MSAAIESEIVWRGRSIRLRYAALRWSVIDHVEIESVDGAPLPFTETGYISHFFDPVTPPYDQAQLIELVLIWLDETAKSKSWVEAETARTQYSLF